MSNEPTDVSAESSERFRTIAEEAPVLIWVNGTEGCEFVNRAYLEFLGVAGEVDIRQFDWAQFVHPDDRDRYVRAYLDCFARRAHFETQLRFRRRDGVYRWMKSVGQPRLGPAGEMLGYLGSMFDVTELKEATEALRAREAQLALVTEMTPVALAQCSRDQRYVFVNRAYAQIVGLAPEEIVGRPIVEIMGEEAYATILPHVEKALLGEVVDYEEEIPFKRAGPRFLRVAYLPHRDERGEVVGWVASISDLTEPKQGGEALRTSEQELERALGFHRAVMANMSEGLYTIDAQGLVTYVNPAAERFFGWSSEELLGRKMHDVTHYKHPDGSAFPASDCAGLQVLTLGTPLIDFEDVFIRKDGSFFPVVYSASPLETEGRINGLVVVFRNVTADKQAQAAVEESSARVEGIVGSAMDAIVSVDAGQRIILFNAAAEKMFRCAATDALGGPLDRFIPTRFRKAHEQHVRGFGETGTTSRAMGALGALSALRTNGEEFPIEASISQVEVRGRKLFTVILRDITERKRAEAATALRAIQRAAVADLSQHALAGRDLDRLMNDAVAVIAQVLGVEFAKLLELTEAGGELLLRAGIGWQPGLVGVRTVPAARESQAGFTLLSDAPVITEDFATETRFHRPALLAEHGVVSGMSVIIGGRARPYGVLGTHTTQRRSFSGDDVHFLQSIADLLATAIERRQLEEELLAATGREQRRLGQDLHDGLCQHLSGIEFRNEALARALEDDPAAREEVKKIGALLREGTRQARMLARGLAPVELEKNGLMSALTELAANSAHLYRIECHFTCEQPVLVTDEATAMHLYRIAQEALSNAVRHARAKSIAIRLRPVGDAAILTIANDGTPLPPEPEREGGMGLRIMRYRAELIGATLRLGSTAEGKTELNCTFNPHG